MYGHSRAPNQSLSTACYADESVMVMHNKTKAASTVGVVLV